MEKFDRNTAMELLEKYNKEPFHIEHGLAVSKAMEYFAKTLGYENDVEFWSLVGLLHDVDYEKYPNEHCKIAPTLLKEIDASDEFIHGCSTHSIPEEKLMDVVLQMVSKQIDSVCE
ncbi:MAG: hypothetical protein IKA39_05140, partial [Clostridia bacterium]|nr:hypothetical protein [Clostridia bacterium]